MGIRSPLDVLLDESVTKIEGDSALPCILRYLSVLRNVSAQGPSISSFFIQVNGIKHESVCLV